jgi:hypothetical protein
MCRLAAVERSACPEQVNMCWPRFAGAAADAEQAHLDPQQHLKEGRHGEWMAETLQVGCLLAFVRHVHAVNKQKVSQQLQCSTVSAGCETAGGHRMHDICNMPAWCRQATPAG